jgi:hypothetical protein
VSYPEACTVELDVTSPSLLVPRLHRDANLHSVARL